MRNHPDFKVGIPLHPNFDYRGRINATTGNNIFGHCSGIGYNYNTGYRQQVSETVDGGIVGAFDLFVHEVGHMLMNIGEYGGHNNQSGGYFFTPAYG